MTTDSATLESLTRRLQRVEDQEAIRDLAAAYHALGCERDSKAMAELFAIDAETDYGQWGLVRGRDDIAEMFWKSIGDDTWVPFTMQFLQNHRYELTDDAGTGRRYILCTLVHNNESYVCVAKFDDEYSKRDGRWYFQKVKLTVHFWVPLREGWAEATTVANHLSEAEAHMQA